MNALGSAGYPEPSAASDNRPTGTFLPVHGAYRGGWIAALAAFRRPRTHVSFTAKSGVESPVSRAARVAAAEPGWRYQEVFGRHDAMVTAPDEVARILLELT